MEKPKHVAKKVRTRFESMKKQIEKARKSGVDVAAARELLKDAEKLLKGKDDAGAMEILESIDGIIKQAKAKKKYELMIFNSIPVMDRARRSGADVGEPEAMLARAQVLLDAGEFGEAHELIKKARMRADNAKHLVMARTHIQQVTPVIEAAKRRGVNVREATDIMIEAWNQLNQGNYDMVTELIKKANTLLAIAEERKGFADSIKDMNARVAAVRDSGADTGAMEELLSGAGEALEREELGDVKRLVNKVRREIEKVILQREAGLSVRTIQQFVREAKRAGVRADELENMLEKASAAVSSGNFSQVQAMELSAKQAVKNLRLFDALTAAGMGEMDRDRKEGFIALIREELEDSRRLAMMAGSEGADVSGVEALIGSAEEALATGQYDMAFGLARKVRGTVQDHSAGFRAAEARSRIEGMLAKVREAEAIGMDISEVGALVAHAKSMLEAGGAEGMAEALDSAENALGGIISGAAGARHPRLRLSVLSDGLEAERWNRASVELSNNGNSAAKNIDVSIIGDMEVKGWEPVPKLLPGENGRQEIAMRSLKPGKVPLDITVSYEKSFDSTKFQLIDMKDMDVAESGSFIVEDAFLIHNNGLLITKDTRRVREEVDGDLFSAMLTAVSEFAKDSFNLEEKIALNRLEFGNNQVLIERGESFFVAVTILGKESVYVPFYISEVVRDIEESYGGALQDWNGDLKELSGIEKMVRRLLLIRRNSAGVPDMDASVLHPALEAMEKGMAVPNLESDVLRLLGEYEEELITGEIWETDGLLDSIRETVEQGIRATGSPEDVRRDSILRESMRYEAEAVRALIAGTGTDTSREEAVLAESLEMLDKGQYERAREALTGIRTQLRERERTMAGEALARQLEELRESLAVASGMGMDITDIQGMAGEAQGALDRGDESTALPLMESGGEMLRSRTGGFMAGKMPKLQVEVRDAGGHEAGAWSRVELVVTNKGNTPARNIDLNFSGDMEVKDPGPVDVIEPNGSRDIELSVRPARAGRLQMDVTASYQRFFDDTKYQLNDMKGMEIQRPGSYIVTDAFLIHNSGLMIGHETRRIKEEVDSDIFSAMLMALTDFVKHAFNLSKDGGLDRMEFDGQKLLIEKGKFVFLAITVSGEESAYLPFFMAEVVKGIEEKYAAALEDWGGDMKPLQGIEELVRDIIFVRKAGEDGEPVMGTSMLAPILRGAADGMVLPDDFEARAARISDILREGGMEAAGKYLEDMERLVEKLSRRPGADFEALKKRMYDLMIRSGQAERDGTLLDARLESYLEVVGKMVDAVNGLRERNGIPEGQILAGVAVKHSDHERWREVVGNMRSLILEQVKARGIQVLGPGEVWGKLVPKVSIDQEHIRASYKYLAGKIVSILQYMPPDKLLANIARGTFTIGVEGQQVYISDDMVSISFSLPVGAYQGELDSGTVYIDTGNTEEAKTDAAVNMLVDRIREMRRELEIEDDAAIEVQILAGDALAESLEKCRNQIMEGCGAYDVLFPLDDPFGGDEYHVTELDMGGETCRIGIVQVEIEG